MQSVTPSDIKTTFLFDLVDILAGPLDVGAGPYGRRIVFNVAGGTFEGPRLRGEVLPGGGDWALFRQDGAMSLDVRLTLRTHDGALIHMTYGGRWIAPPDVQKEARDWEKGHLVDPARYYFRTNPLFETGATQYAWLNDVVALGSGYRIPRGIAYKVFHVL